MATINGYTHTMVDALVNKHKHRSDIRNATTLLNLKEPPIRISMPYFGSIFHKLNCLFWKLNIELVPKSNSKLSNFLTSTKKPIAKINQPGVYVAKCNDCDAEYIGQTKRELLVQGK